MLVKKEAKKTQGLIKKTCNKKPHSPMIVSKAHLPYYNSKNRYEIVLASSKNGLSNPLPSKNIEDTLSNISEDSQITPACTLSTKRRTPHMFQKPGKALGENKPINQEFGPVHFQFVDKLPPKLLPVTSDSLIDSTLSFNGKDSFYNKGTKCNLQNLIIKNQIKNTTPKTCEEQKGNDKGIKYEIEICVKEYFNQ